MSVSYLRHCQSLFNAQGVLERNVGLSIEGKTYAAKLTGHYDVVLCSPMKRAQDTLYGSPITYDSIVFETCLREHKNGNIINYFPGEAITIEKDDDVYSRVGDIKDLIEKYKGKNILVISHHGILHYLLDKYFGNGEIMVYKNE